VSLNQVLEMLQKISGKTLEAKYEAARDGDIRDSLADIRLAQESLGYEPSVHFEEGLQRTFAWYQAQHAKNIAG
jgi:UDP-glucose 4-epimerase